MYCGYGYSATTLALRAKPSLCRTRRLALLDDPGGDEYPLRGISINPRLLLYGYYWRHSSLIYWSPLRSFLAGHDGHSYSRIIFRDEEPCSPRVSTGREGCMDCCCCCRSSRRSYRRIEECCRENYGDRIWEDETDCDESVNSRRYAKRGTGIRSNDREKVQCPRARKDGSCSVCPSCGSASRKSAGRNIDRESNREVNATVRKGSQVQKIEDAAGYDSTQESDESDKCYDASVSNRKATGRKTNEVGFSHQEKEDRHSTKQDKINIRDSRRKSRNCARISVEDEDFNVASKSNNVVDSREVDKGKHFSSLKQHTVVDKRLVEKDTEEFDKRVQEAALWSSSAPRIDEDYHEKQHIGRRESREGSQHLATVSDVHEDDTMMASRCNKIVDERKVDMASSSRSMAKHHHQVDKKFVEQEKMRTDVRGEYVHREDQVTNQSQSREGSERFMRISEAHKDYAEKITRRENILSAKKENKEQSSISTLKKYTAIDRQLIGSHKTREHIQNRRQLEEVHSSNMQRALNEERQHQEMIVKNRDDKSISVHAAIDNKGQVNQQDIDKKEVDELHENRASGFSLRENEKANSSQSILQCRIDDQVDYSTSTMNVVHQAGNLQNLSERQRQFTKHSSLQQRESGSSSGVSELLRKDTGRLSSAQIIYTSDIKNELDDCQHDSKRVSAKDSRISKYSSTDIQRDSNLQELSNMRIGNRIDNTSLLLVQDEKKKRGILIGETSQPTNQETTFTGMLDDGSSLLDANMQQLDDQTQRLKMYDKGGALDSASRLESSSAIYVCEFMDKLRQETSSFKISSGTQTEKTQNKSHQDAPMKSESHSARKKDKDDKCIQESSRRSSSGSGTKGPSDEIWDVKRPISQEDSKTEASEEDGLIPGIVNSRIVTPTTENTIVRRNPKSLWAHVADILRMGWAHRAESHSSTQKSGKRISSDGSEAWFSGQDASDNENDMNRSSDLKELLPVRGPIDQGHETHSSITQGSLLEAPGIAIMELGSGASTSVEILGGNVYKGTSRGTSLEEIELAKNEKESKNITSGTISFDQPPQPLTGDASSVIIDQNTGNLAGPVSGYVEDHKIEEPSEVDNTEGNDGEIKRRKLQRNKQVLKETFEDWEEAYRLESEQRKIDEFFMREALVEAQNAADIWEVPVGAVLVHNGKIIARGFNLVEEKRDSTAHAEMICIREASNLLRTWRLADTTLYVTLEPCPMCAGAILQARIDTVVWGAPNKLLGADGSWVRLFPGDGGNNSLDASSQVAGPVHPFHPNIQIRRGVLATECSDVLQQFFQLRRKKKKQESPPPTCLPVPNHPIKLFRKMHNIFSIFC